MEIRRSKSRFISILLIVALGVAVFSGIQASSPDMRYSGDAYYDESNLMDLKVVGTMGLTDADVKAIEAVDGVESAEGAWSTDVMCGDGEKQKVLHIEAINETVNSLDVQEGKLPQNSGEIFLDNTFASANDYSLGDKVVLREGEDSSLLVISKKGCNNNLIRLKLRCRPEVTNDQLPPLCVFFIPCVQIHRCFPFPGCGIESKI